jgi:hypothetical protein
MLPWRSDDPTCGPRPDLPLPGRGRLPRARDGRPLKRWRYVGAYGRDVMLCVGFARVGGLPQGWWAVWHREAAWLRERTIFWRPERAVRFDRGRVTVRDGDAAIDLVVDEAPGVETICPHGGGYVWTRKQAGVAVRGTVRIGAETVPIEAFGVVDDSAGYHDRETVWRWSAGVGTLADGRRVGWNLVEGVNDPPVGSERSVWVDGVAHEVGPVDFAADLSSVGGLRFHAEATRERHDELVLMRSDYLQPFGTFSGELDGLALAEGYGVMEDHRARW